MAVTYAMEFDNVETLKRAVEIDTGVAILPQSTIRQEVAKQTLAALPIAEGNFYIVRWPPFTRSTRCFRRP